MKRAQVAGLVAGTVLGLGAVAVGVALARREGREAARRFLDEYGPKGTQAAQNLAEQAKRAGEQVAKAAREQYQTQVPRARGALREAWNQAPQTIGALTAALPRAAGNGTATTAVTEQPEA